MKTVEPSESHEPSAEEVIARARQKLAAHQRQAAEQGWQGPWRWIPPVLSIVVLVAFFAAPGPLPSKLLLAMGGVCGLRPSHSYFAGPLQLPLEARMVGIFAGFALTLLALLLLRRFDARRLGSRPTLGLLALFFASMVFDGINSTLYEFGDPYLYPPSNPLRLLTGLLSGIAAAPFLVWLLALVAVPKDRAHPKAVVHALWEPLALLLPAGLFAVLVMSETRLAYAPAALLSVGGMVLMIAITVLAAIVVSTQLNERVTRWQQLIAPGALALLIAFGVLAATAYVRWTTVGTM